MKVKNCLNCKYAAWHRTKAGKLHPDGGGRCTWVPDILQLPPVKYWVGGTPFIGGGYISRKKDLKEDCVHFTLNDDSAGLSPMKDEQ